MVSGVGLDCAYSVTIYHVWRERNAHFFNNIAKDGDVILQSIERDVRDRCVAHGGWWKTHISNWLLCLSRNISTRILKSFVVIRSELGI